MDNYNKNEKRIRKDKYHNFLKEGSFGHFNKYDDPKYIAAVPIEITDDFYYFLKNKWVMYGKYIMLEPNISRNANNNNMLEHQVFNTVTKLNGRYQTYYLKETAFKPTPFFWIFSHLGSMWRSMINRCYKPSDNRYDAYGARGIRVCRDWYNPDDKDFRYGQLREKENFRYFCMLNGYANNPDLEIDRYDENGNYEYNNCQLVDHWYNTKFQAKTKIIHLNFNNIIHIYDTETAFSKFIGKNHGYLHEITNKIENDNERLDITVNEILKNLPEDFLIYAETVFNQIGINKFNVDYDRKKPWYKTEWLNSYRIS